MNRRCARPGLVTIAAIVSLGGTAVAFAAGQEGAPLDRKQALCAEMATVAMRAQFNRDKGRPMPVYPDDGSAAARIANDLTRRVYEEPSITGPKRAEAFGRVYCAERLQ